MMMSYFNALHHISMYILTKLSNFFGGTLFGLGNLQSFPRFSGQMCFLERVHMTISTWKSLRQAGHVSQIAHLKRDPFSPEWSFCPMIRLMVGVIGTPQIYHKKSASHQGSKHYSPITMEQWGRVHPRVDWG